MLMQMGEVLKKGTTITNLGLTFILLRVVQRANFTKAKKPINLYTHSSLTDNCESVMGIIQQCMLILDTGPSFTAFLSTFLSSTDIHNPFLYKLLIEEHMAWASINEICLFLTRMV